MQNFNVATSQSSDIRYTENIENTDPKNLNNSVQNTETTADYTTRLSIQNSVGNAHNAASRIVGENTAQTAISTKGKNFLLRFFDNIGSHLRKIFSSLRSGKSIENPSSEPVQSSSDTLRNAPEQNMDALNAIEQPQETNVFRNNKKLSFGELKQNLEKRLSELRALPEPDYGQINNLETRLSCLKELNTMGSFLHLRFQTMSVSKYAEKKQISDAKKNLETLEKLGIKSLKIPGGFETAWQNQTNRRLLGTLSSSTIDLDFETFEKLYQNLQSDDCLRNKKFTDLMKATSELMETTKRNMATVANVFAMDSSKLGETLRQQLYRM